MTKNPWLMAELNEIAVLSGRLTISRHDPEKFFSDRSEVVERLRRVIAALQHVQKTRDLREAREAKTVLEILPPSEVRRKSSV